MALGPVTLGGAIGVPLAQRQFGPTFRLRSLPNAGPSAALTAGRGASAARLQVGITPGQLDIDYTALRASMGYYQPLGLLREIVGYTHKVRARAIARIVSDGDQLAKPYTGVNMIAKQAYQGMLEDQQTHQYGIGFLPKVPPQITYTPGQTTIDVVF
jgi:hypothetical protein